MKDTDSASWLKDTDSASWFISLRDALYKFELPSPLKLLENPPENLQWKRTTHQNSCS